MSEVHTKHPIYKSAKWNKVCLQKRETEDASHYPCSPFPIKPPPQLPIIISRKLLIGLPSSFL